MRSLLESGQDGHFLLGKDVLYKGWLLAGAGYFQLCKDPLSHDWPVAERKFKTKSITLWVISTFSELKPSILHSFLLFSRAIKCDKFYEITPKKRFLWEAKKTNFKCFKFHKIKSYAWRFYLCFRNSCEIWNLFSCTPI